MNWKLATLVSMAGQRALGICLSLPPILALQAHLAMPEFGDFYKGAGIQTQVFVLAVSESSFQLPVSHLL